MLAFALGPLEAADLLALMKHIHGTSGVMAGDRLLEPLQRQQWTSHRKHGCITYCGLHHGTNHR